MKRKELSLLFALAERELSMLGDSMLLVAGEPDRLELCFSGTLFECCS